MGDIDQRKKSKEKSPSTAQQSTLQLKSSLRKGLCPSPSKDGIPSYYFTPRKAFSQEVASSPLISDLEMDALTAECGDIMRAVADSMTSEEEASPAKMGPPSTQKYHAVDTPNTKKDREVRQMLLQDLECSESERDTPFKKDSPQNLPITRAKNVTPEASTSAQTTTRVEPAKVAESVNGKLSLISLLKCINNAVLVPPGIIPSKSMSLVRPSSSSDEDSPDSKSEESSGDELDVHSSNFNPKKALSMGRQFLPFLPFPNTKRLKSLAQYDKVAAAAEKSGDFEKHMARALKRKTKKNKEAAVVQRNFLPEQMPVPGNFWNKGSEKNLLDRMESFSGPMAKLAEYRDKKIRVMVSHFIEH